MSRRRGPKLPRLAWRGRGETFASRVAETCRYRAFVWRFGGSGWQGRCEVLGGPCLNDLGRSEFRVVSWGVSRPFTSRRTAERWCARQIHATRRAWCEARR